TRLDALTTQWMKGVVVESAGTNSPTTQPLEIYRKAPDKMLMKRELANDALVQAFDGRIAWRQFKGRVGEMSGVEEAFARRDARFDRDLNLKEQFTRMSVIGRERLGGHDVYLIEALPNDGHIGGLSYGAERLFFDIQTGLLLKRLIEIETVLGQLPIAT